MAVHNSNKQTNNFNPGMSSRNKGRDRERFDRFLVMEPREGSFDKMSPFLIDKEIKRISGPVQSIRKIRDGLLIEVNNPSQSLTLLKQKKFDTLKVEVTPHKNLNSSKGVISCRDLLNCPEEEIIENLRPQGITNVKRLMTTRNGIRQESASCILTFDTPVIPKRVMAGYISVPVRTYYPPPMRCFRCQKFGHTSHRCESEEICICGNKSHVGSPCQEPIQCVNCGNAHTARSRDCPIYKIEEAIQKIKINEHLTYHEAKRKLKERSHDATTRTYATVARPTPQHNSQTSQIITALIPEISRVIENFLDKHNNDPIQPNTQFTPIGNPIPTSVLRKNKGVNQSLRENTQLDPYEDIPLPRLMRSKLIGRTRRKRSVTEREISMTSSPATSAAEDGSIIESADNLAPPQKIPPNKKQDREHKSLPKISRPREHLEMDIEPQIDSEPEESMFDATTDHTPTTSKPSSTDEIKIT